MDAKGRRDTCHHGLAAPTRPSFATDLALFVIVGAGKARPRPRPAARLRKKMQAAGTTGSAEQPGLPCAMALRLTLRSSQGPALLPLSSAQIQRQLDLSTGRPEPRSLTVRTVLFVRMTKGHAAARHAHRIPHPTFVTTAKRPS